MDVVIEILEGERPSLFHMIPPVVIGDHSYVGDNSHIAQYTEIGKFCGIGNLCTIGAQPHHPEFLANYPIEFLMGEKHVKGTPTFIGNDVWIGSNSVILAGVKIGDGAVIGAGAVVTKDVPPYAVMAGSPARQLRYRLPIEQIDALIKLKWWNFPLDAIQMLPINDVKKCIEVLQAMTILRDEGTLECVMKKIVA